MSQMSINSQLNKNNSIRLRNSIITNNTELSNNNTNTNQQQQHSTTPTPRESIVFNRGDDQPPISKILSSLGKSSMDSANLFNYTDIIDHGSGGPAVNSMADNDEKLVIVESGGEEAALIRYV